MAVYLDLFSPETYEAFSRSDRTVSGFRERQRSAAERVLPGDRLYCYLTKVSRWVGVLEVLGEAYLDDSPVFYPSDDPFKVRFRVRTEIWLPVEHAVPIHESRLFDHLSFTAGQPRNTSRWTGKLRCSLTLLSPADAQVIYSALLGQVQSPHVYAMDPATWKRYLPHKVPGTQKDHLVVVPDETPPLDDPEPMVRESTRVQALLAEIGARMGLQVWVPRQDRAAVQAAWRGAPPSLLERLPLNYEEATLRTVEQIDVLWLRGRAIKRAFEVEHTTSIYSGILRMADLLALQPNMDIRMHLVAPADRRDKVFGELLRPVFSLFEKGPLSQVCTYLSYESVSELADQQHLTHMSDSVIDEYAEEAEA